MIITCPSCFTKFSLEEDRIPERGAKARCSKCQWIFLVQKPEESEKDFSSPDVSSEEIPDQIEEGKVETEFHRRKNVRRRFPSLGFLVVLIILGAGSYGVYEYKDKIWQWRPDQFSLPNLRQLVGLREETEGLISLENLRGTYVDTVGLNRIFVVEGLAVNNYRERRSFIKVKGILLDAHGKKVQEKTVYCGNILAEKDFKELSREAIEKSLSSQFGTSMSNVNISPKKAIPFMIVFTDPLSGGPAEKSAPEAAGKAGEASPGPSDFSVEVVSSQRGSK
jgi:predicted Zn finger-like uncharacterized protein